jgi:hypothetical protein
VGAAQRVMFQREREGQMGIPGTERVTLGDILQRRASAPLRSRAEQRSMDEGLFGDDAAQCELFQEGAPPFYSAVSRRD